MATYVQVSDIAYIYLVEKGLKFTAQKSHFPDTGKRETRCDNLRYFKRTWSELFEGTADQ